MFFWFWFDFDYFPSAYFCTRGLNTDARGWAFTTFLEILPRLHIYFMQCGFFYVQECNGDLTRDLGFYSHPKERPLAQFSPSRKLPPPGLDPWTLSIRGERLTNWANPAWQIYSGSLKNKKELYVTFVEILVLFINYWSANSRRPSQ